MATVADLHAPASHRDIRTDKGNGQHETGGAPDAHGEQAPRMHPQYGRVS